jgi:hypothetical protein
MHEQWFWFKRWALDNTCDAILWVAVLSTANALTMFGAFLSHH